MIGVQAFGAKKHKVYQKPVYMIGVAISLTDSVVFISDMHLVDSVTVEKKTKFLKDRQLYSFQLQRYLEATYKGAPYVPAIFFGTKRKTMERRYLSLHKRYVQSKDFRMVLVDQSQFRFKSEKYIEEVTE
jgi:predicted NodU family carbamoyl transferase